MNKTITREFTVYSFSELSEDAKEKVRANYLEWNRCPEDFQDIMNYDLTELFPASDLKLAFEVSFSQSDFMGIYGNLSLIDAVNIVSIEFKNDFTEKEIRFLKWAVSEYPQNVELTGNSNYFRKYGIAWNSDLTYNLIYDLECGNIRGIRYKTLEKFETKLTGFLEELCKAYFTEAEKYFYEADDSEVEEWAEDNGYYFTENGKIFY